MKKLILIMFVVLLVGTISAFEFDNVKNYDEKTKTIDIRNSVLGIPFLQLGKVAEIKLNTPINYLVPRGYNKVAEFQVTSFDDYNNAFKELELFKGDNKFTRSYDFKVLSYETIYIDDYRTECVDNKTCSEVLFRTREIQKEVWTELSESNFKKDEVVTIGIFTTVEKGDRVEWIPNFFGVRINEWAVWTESLNTGILSFYRLNLTSGSVEDAAGNFTGTNNGADRGGVGIINNSFGFTAGNSDYVDVTKQGTLATGMGSGFTLSTWIKTTSTTSSTLFGQETSGSTILYIKINTAHSTAADAGKVMAWYRDGSAASLRAGFTADNNAWRDGDWAHLVITVDPPNDNITFHIDGSLIARSYGAQDTPSDFDAFGEDLLLGALNNQGTPATFITGELDEVGIWNRVLSTSEIVDLYNGGAGITFIGEFLTPPEITLVSPANDTDFGVNNIDFNVTVIDDVEVSEVILFIDGILNDTNTSLVNGTYLYNLDFSDGNHNWSIGATDDMGTTTNSSVRIFSVDTQSPVITNQNITEAGVGGIISLHVINTNLTFTWNVEDTNLDTCTFNHAGNVTVNCTVNTTSLNITDFSNRNLTFIANDTFGNENSVFVTWDYNVSQFTSTFSATTFETKTETFQANITLGADLNGSTISNVRLFFNGSENTGGTSVNTAGQNFNLSQTIDIPLIGSTNSSWFFSFDADGVTVNTTTETQTVTELLFQLCNATHATQFINFSFRNETVNEETVTAAISSSTWVFYLGEGLVNKTLTFSNATENLNYTFCSSATTDILFTTSTLAYTNSISQQRIFEPTLLTLTSATDARILYLLPTVDGLFSTFRTEDTLGNTIVGATGSISRILNGVDIDVTTDSTDGSGLVVYFLDPDITYTAVFGASGFIDNSFTFVPTTDLRTVIMSSVTEVTGGSNISLGMSYIILPTNATLNNGTDITFSFNVSSTETITFMGFTISNDTTTFLSVNQAGDGFISGTINTGNNNTLSGLFTITTANETIILTRTWKIEQGFIGDYSIFRQFSLYMDYGFKDFIRLLMVIATLAIVMIFMSREIGIDDEVKMVVVILIVWAFSIVGWLDTGVTISGSSSSINNLSQFSNQYGIAIVSTVAAAYFILRRAFRQI